MAIGTANQTETSKTNKTTPAFPLTVRGVDEIIRAHAQGKAKRYYPANGREGLFLLNTKAGIAIWYLRYVKPDGSRGEFTLFDADDNALACFVYETEKQARQAARFMQAATEGAVGVLLRGSF